MPSRFPSGKSTTKYDTQTPPETLNTVVNIGDRITKITAMVEGPIRKDIDNLEAKVGSCRDRIDVLNHDVGQIRSSTTQMNSVLELFIHFIHSRFFRFLNFFGRWFIYGPDDRIYINNEQNRNLVKTMLSTPKKEGLRGHDSENEDILTVLDLMDGTGRSFRLFRFKGTLDGAKDELKRRHILLQLGDHLETLGDGKSYIWATDMDDVCDLYEVGKLPYLNDYGTF